MVLEVWGEAQSMRGKVCSTREMVIAERHTQLLLVMRDEVVSDVVVDEMVKRNLG